MRRAIDLIPGLLAFALASGFGAAARAQGEDLTDIVLLIDVSGSMRAVDVGGGRVITYDELKTRLRDFIDGQLPPRSDVTIITIGEQPSRLGQFTIRGQADRQGLSALVGGLQPTARYTHIAGSLQIGLAELVRLKRQAPRRTRLLFLITDGHNNPPPGVPKLTFDQLREQMARDLKLVPGDDFYFWYAHLGQPDPEIQRWTQGVGGESWNVVNARDLMLAYFGFNRRVIRLPAQPPGDWSQEYPPRAERERGEWLRVEGTEGTEVRLGPATFPGLPPGAGIEVEPRSFVLRAGENDVDLRFRARGVPPGHYEGRLALGSSSKLAIRTPASFHVLLDVARPVVSAAADEGLTRLRLAPGREARGRLRLEADEVAKGLRPTVRAELRWDRAPEGVAVEVVPAEVGAGDRPAVALTARVRPDARPEPGRYPGTLALSTDTPYVAIQPATVPILLEVEPARVALVNQRIAVPLSPGQTRVELPEGIPFRRGDLPAELPIRGRLGPPGAATLPIRIESPAFDVPAGRGSIPLAFRVDEEALRRMEPNASVAVTIPIRGDGLTAFEPQALTVDLLVLPMPPTSIPIVQPQVLVSPQDKEITILVQPHGLPAGKEIPIRIGRLSTEGGREIPFRVEVVDEPVVSREKPTITLRLVFTGAYPENPERIAVQLETAERNVRFQPEQIQLVLDQIEGTHPDFLTSRTRVWPFQYAIRLEGEAARTRASEWSFEYQFPNHDWARGSVEPVGGGEPALRLVAPGWHGALKDLQPGTQAVQFRLRRNDREVRTWSALVQVARPQLEGLAFYRDAGDRAAPLALQGQAVVEADAPLHLEVHPQARPAPELRPHWIPKEVLLFVVPDRDGSLREGPAGAEAQALAQQLREKPPAAGSAGGPRVVRIADLGGPGMLPILSRDYRPNYLLGARERAEDDFVWALALYPDGAEEWTDIYRVHVRYPGQRSWLALGLAGGVLLMALALGSLALARHMLPPPSSWQLKVFDSGGRVEFVPPDGATHVGRFDEAPGSLRGWLAGLWSPWPGGRVRLAPGAGLVYDPALRARSTQDLRCRVGWKGLYLRPQFDGRAGTRPLPAGRWTRVAGYHDGQAQRWCREPLAVSVWLRPGDPAYPYPISLEWSAPETPQPRWLGAIWEVAQFLWGGILWIVKRMKGLT